MKTLHDIEQHARELAGGEFEVDSGDDGWGGLFVFVKYEPDSSDEAWFPVDSDMTARFAVDLNRPDYAKVARFVSLCSQLDAWIKGDAK